MEAPLSPGRGSDEEERVSARLLGPPSPASPSRWNTAGPAPPAARGRRAACGRLVGLAAPLALGLAAAGALAARGWRRGAAQANHSLLRASPERLDATRGMDFCERCPVGSCVTGSGSACILWDQHHHGGGYYCQVESCSQVPFSAHDAAFHFSECWKYRGNFFYAVNDPHFPCKDASPDQRGDLATTTTTRKTTTTELTTVPTTTTVTTTTTLEVTHTPQAPTTTSTPPSTTTEPRTSTTEEASTTTSTLPSTTTHARTTTEEAEDERSRSRPTGAKSIFDLEAERVADEATLHDARLAAYWDLSDCGPAGDDNNVEWCGGLVDEPDCRQEVEVDMGVCLSEKAELSSVHHKKGRNVELAGCTFVYFAQYVCIATTTTTTTITETTSTTSTTTTVSSTTTSSSTTTTSATSTTTSTTSSTTTSTYTTTTIIEEKDMFDAIKALEKEITGPDGTWSAAAGLGPSCDSTFRPPPAPLYATDLNGVRLPDVCFPKSGAHFVHIIADWGGMLGAHGPYPACQRPKVSFVKGVDDQAQQRVAFQMAARALLRSPDYVLNGGDNFYWGGIDTSCGATARTIVPTGQLQWNWDQVYKGPGLDGKPWLGVLGNHDYGGFRFDKGWDQLISYTWGPSGRWVMPGQYWTVTVRYPGFSVDYYFLDTNYFNAKDPHADPEHNICSDVHTPPEATCGPEGPSNVSECSPWFSTLWDKQKRWLEERLARSEADWQMVVTHFPPYYGRDFWEPAAHKYGIDMIISGHVHVQELHTDDASNFLRPTAWIVSGGGGGITSEDVPDVDGHDDQYGFFELTLTKDIIEVQGISHGGSVRKKAFVRPRLPAKVHRTED